MRKGQSEAFGIAIIVLILIIALLIFVSSSQREVFQSSSDEMSMMMIDNYLKALLSGDVRYNVGRSHCSWKMDRLLAIAYVDSITSLECDPYTIDTDEFVKLRLDTIIESTLGEWGMHYYLSIKDETDDEKYSKGSIIPSECTRILGSDTKMIASNTLQIELIICSQ